MRCFCSTLLHNCALTLINMVIDYKFALSCCFSWLKHLYKVLNRNQVFPLLKSLFFPFFISLGFLKIIHNIFRLFFFLIRLLIAILALTLFWAIALSAAWSIILENLVRSIWRNGRTQVQVTTILTEIQIRTRSCCNWLRIFSMIWIYTLSVPVVILSRCFHLLSISIWCYAINNFSFHNVCDSSLGKFVCLNAILVWSEFVDSRISTATTSHIYAIIVLIWLCI